MSPPQKILPQQTLTPGEYELPAVPLDERELYAYQKWQRSDRPPIAPSTQAQFFTLFLAGKTCEEIRQLNPSFGLGEIVGARVHGNWDALLKEHLSTLMLRTRQRVEQVVLETVDVLADALTAKNKLWRGRLLKFIQTGDETELGDLKLDGMKGYKDLAEALMKITGQDKNTKISGEILHRYAEPEAASPGLMTTAQKASRLATMAAAQKARSRG